MTNIEQALRDLLAAIPKNEWWTQKMARAYRVATEAIAERDLGKEPSIDALKGIPLHVSPILRDRYTWTTTIVFSDDIVRSLNGQESVGLLSYLTSEIEKRIRDWSARTDVQRILASEDEAKDKSG